MSKFYYQGEIRQENYLTAKDVFLRSVYGKYQLMIFEALLLILFGISSLVIDIFDLEQNINIIDFYSRYFGGLLVILALTNLICYYTILKKQYGVILKAKSYLFLVIGLVLLIFPMKLSTFLIPVTTSIFLLCAFRIMLRQGPKTTFDKVMAFSFIAAALFLIFSPSFDGIKEDIYFGFLTVCGVYLLVKGIRFRKSLKKFEDEEKGFTDYKIV